MMHCVFSFLREVMRAKKRQPLYSGHAPRNTSAHRVCLARRIAAQHAEMHAEKGIALPALLRKLAASGHPHLWHCMYSLFQKKRQGNEQHERASIQAPTPVHEMSETQERQYQDASCTIPPTAVLCRLAPVHLRSKGAPFYVRRVPPVAALSAAEFHRMRALFGTPGPGSKVLSSAARARRLAFRTRALPVASPGSFL